MCRTLACSFAALVVVSLSVAATQHSGTEKKEALKPAAPSAGQEQAMSAEDKAYMEAMMPGPMHEHLMKAVGNWKGTFKMWQSPETDPKASECTSTVTSLFGGRYTQAKFEGEMPDFGPFSGLGLYGYDNVAKQFQANWIDTMGTGMMQGTGKLSEDGKTLTWTMSFYCPIQKKQCIMREVETMTGENSVKMEFFGPHPATGKEFKVMEIALTRQAGTHTAEAHESH